MFPVFLLNLTSAGQRPPLDDLSDSDLMVRYADQRDVRAFEELVERHEDGLLNFIIGKLGDRARAEELLQETFARVVESADDYRPDSAFSTWLYTIARNLCIDELRTRGGDEASLDAPIDDDEGTRFVDRIADSGASSATVDHDRRVFRRRFERALDALSAEQREVFLLREFSRRTYSEIAEVVDAPVGTVKSRMRYALQDLRRHLDDWADHSFDREERGQIEPEA
ncbi:MAG: sigma-70 family RNA polymerase sigma factor [Bradymonadaceae bacterium]